MRVLLLGKNGQVGWELQRSLAPIGDVVALGRHESSPYCGNLEALEELAGTIRDVRPDVIVNAAAYTAVDRAEAEPELARTINAIAPGVLAAEAQKLGALMVHYSTDYVFDGSGSMPWREEDPTDPLNTYGRTKLEGERRIRESGCLHLILRTSWVYASRGKNFARTMLTLASERESLDVIDDQVGAPTGADLLADVTAHMVPATIRQPELGGTYHCVASGVTSWHGYASHVIEFARRAGGALRVTEECIRPVSSSAFKTAAKRPRNSRMSTEKLISHFGLTLPDWRSGVDRMLSEILEK